MTRTHKTNDVPKNHPEAAEAFAEHQIPKFFGKVGHAGEAPTKVKKNGGGRGNWGAHGEEAEDLAAYTTFNKSRRRSNSISHNDTVTTKFDHNEPVEEYNPVFGESAKLEEVADIEEDNKKV